MAKARYIAIDGPMGVGKTVLGKELARHLKASFVADLSSDNPFLGRFLRDRKAHAFQTQVFFLLHRFQQQGKLKQVDLFHRNTVADYLFARDQLYAFTTLSEEEQSLYRRIFDSLSHKPARPDLAVYLQASVDVLHDRLSRGDGPYHRLIPRSFLQEVVKAYDDFFFYYTESPLLVINTSELDLSSSAEDREHLIDVIRRMKSGGTEHYIPVRSGT